MFVIIEQPISMPVSTMRKHQKRRQLVYTIKSTSITQYFKNDTAFDALYPAHISEVAEQHWTPLHIARQVAEFLGDDGKHVLDIGSGAGKFCLAAAHYARGTHFTGVEVRKKLVKAAADAQRKLGIENVTFIHGNFMDLDLARYDHFYFYNAFYEHINEQGRIDNDVPFSDALFEYYADSLSKMLTERPVGTKIATYHSFHGEIPIGYERVACQGGGELTFWVRR